MVRQAKNKRTTTSTKLKRSANSRGPRKEFKFPGPLDKMKSEGKKPERPSVVISGENLSEDAMQLSTPGVDEISQPSTPTNKPKTPMSFRRTSPKFKNRCETDESGSEGETRSETTPEPSQVEIPSEIREEFQSLLSLKDAGDVDSRIEALYTKIVAHALESEKPAAVSADSLGIDLSKDCVDWAEKLRKEKSVSEKAKKKRARDLKIKSEVKMDAWAERRMKGDAPMRRRSMSDCTTSKEKWSKDGSLIRLCLTRSKSARFARDDGSPIQHVPDVPKKRSPKCQSARLSSDEPVFQNAFRNAWKSRQQQQEAKEGSASNSDADDDSVVDKRHPIYSPHQVPDYTKILPPGGGFTLGKKPGRQQKQQTSTQQKRQLSGLFKGNRWIPTPPKLPPTIAAASKEEDGEEDNFLRRKTWSPVGVSDREFWADTQA